MPSIRKEIFFYLNLNEIILRLHESKLLRIRELLKLLKNRNYHSLASTREICILYGSSRWKWLKSKLEKFPLTIFYHLQNYTFLIFK